MIDEALTVLSLVCARVRPLSRSPRVYVSLGAFGVNRIYEELVNRVSDELIVVATRNFDVRDKKQTEDCRQK